MSLIQQISAFINDAITSTTTVWSSQKIANELAAITGGVSFQGGYDVALNTPDLVTPVAGVVDKGFMYIATTGGTFFGETLEVGDVLIAKVDDPSALVDWVLIQGNQMIQSLESVLSVGNTSGANDIVMADVQKVQLGANANQFINNLDANTVQLSVQRFLDLIIAGSGDNVHWIFDDASFAGDSDDFSMGFNFPDGTIQFIDKDTGYAVVLQFNDLLTGSATISLPLTSGRLALTSQLPVSASTTVQGIIEIATGLEINGGTDNTRAISPFGLANSTLASNVATNNAKVTNATHTGDVTGATALTIANNAVTNAKAAQMAANTVKVNNTGALANAADLAMPASTFLARLASGDIIAATVAQVKTLIGNFTSVLAGLVPASGGGTTNFLRADGTWANPASGNTFLTTTVSPASFNTSQDDYSPAGLAPKCWLRLDATANVELRGLNATGFADRDTVGISSVGTGDVKIKDDDALSTAANRFLTNGDFTIKPNQGCILIYDGTSLRWRIFVHRV